MPSYGRPSAGVNQRPKPGAQDYQTRSGRANQKEGPRGNLDTSHCERGEQQGHRGEDGERAGNPGHESKDVPIHPQLDAWRGVFSCDGAARENRERRLIQTAQAATQAAVAGATPVSASQACSRSPCRTE